MSVKHPVSLSDFVSKLPSDERFQEMKMKYVFNKRDAKAFMQVADGNYDYIFIGQGHIITTNGVCLVMANVDDVIGKPFVRIPGEFIRKAIKNKSNIIVDFEKMICKDESYNECELCESHIKHKNFLKFFDHKPEEIKTSFLNIAGDIMERIYKFSKDLKIHKFMSFKQISGNHTVIVWEKVDNVVGLVCNHSGFRDDENEFNDFLNELLSEFK